MYKLIQGKRAMFKKPKGGERNEEEVGEIRKYMV